MEIRSLSFAVKSYNSCPCRIQLLNGFICGGSVAVDGRMGGGGVSQRVCGRCWGGLSLSQLLSVVVLCWDRASS